MRTGRIAIHAASGLKEDEFRWGHWRLMRHGVSCPRPDALVRSAIIGAVDVVDIVSESDSEWFGGEKGLVLANAEMCDPIPCVGALGYFAWTQSGTFSEVKPWMRSYDLPSGDAQTGELFPELPPSFEHDPTRPRRSTKRGRD